MEISGTAQIAMSWTWPGSATLNVQGGSLFASEEVTFIVIGGRPLNRSGSERDRLGIKPGGIDESATEPPPPASRQPHGPQEKEDEGFSPAETMHPKPKDYEIRK